MHRIHIFDEAGTWFAREDRFVMPLFDGNPTFSFDFAFATIGATQLSKGEYKTRLTLPDVVSYLSEVQSSGEPITVTAARWLRGNIVRQIEPLPFTGRRIDWRQVEKMVEDRVRVEFPFCV